MRASELERGLLSPRAPAMTGLHNLPVEVRAPT